jgi:hypothetical protein
MKPIALELFTSTNLHIPPPSTFNTSRRDIRRHRTRQKQHHIRSIVNSARPPEGYIRRIPELLCVRGDTRHNVLPSNQNLVLVRRRLGQSRIHPTVCDSIAADIVSSTKLATP